MGGSVQLALAARLNEKRKPMISAAPIACCCCVKSRYKITDVSLLSLAERCLGLRHLELANLEKISDTGISWLASGCVALACVPWHNRLSCEMVKEACLPMCLDYVHLTMPILVLRSRSRSGIWTSATASKLRTPGCGFYVRPAQH